MNLTTIRSDSIYRQIANAKDSNRDDLYRYELMKPFEKKWNLVGLPLKSAQPNGYDVVTAAPMNGWYAPSQITPALLPIIDQLSNEELWTASENSIRQTLDEFTSHGINLKVKDYLYTLILSDPLNPMTAFTTDCCGDGGIPGYILASLVPNETTLRKLPVVLAHETNHNIRWQFVPWSASTTLADLVVSEGLAESYEAFRYGEENIGPWATALTKDEVITQANPIIKEHLQETDFQKISSFLYGDGIMKLRGSAPVGVPDYAGYSCGYHLIQHYLKKTGASIYDATITPTEDILKEVTDFWR